MASIDATAIIRTAQIYQETSNARPFDQPNPWQWAGAAGRRSPRSTARWLRYRDPDRPGPY